MHVCEYCEKSCKCGEGRYNCICPCQDEFETNITCERCLHDMLYCTCSEEAKQKDIDDLFEKLNELVEETRKRLVKDYDDSKK